MAIGVFMPMVPGLGGDPYFDNVSMLLHGNSSPIIDSSSYGLVPDDIHDQATVDTSIFKFGGGSLLFNGASAMAFTSVTAAQSPQAGDFTLELWARFRTLSGQQIFWSGGYGNGGWFIFYMEGNTLTVARQGIQVVLSYNWPGRALNTWYHIAVSRQAGTMRLFVDGILVQSGSVTTNFPIGTAIVLGLYGGTAASRLNAYVDDLRFTKGICRYTSTFTPPSSEFPDH